MSVQTAPQPPSSTSPPPQQFKTRTVNPRREQDVRRTLLALLASVIGVLPLCELISDLGWLADVWLTMIIVIAPAVYLRTRRAPSAGQIWIGLVLIIPWLTFRFVHQHALLAIIPTPGTGHDLARLMTGLHHTTSVQSAPVHSTTAIKLALCLLMALVAALVDLIAVVGRRGALAGIPLLVVFTVSGAVPRQPVSWWLFALAASGFLILLALDSSDELHRWGHYVPREYALKSRTAETGQRIAIIAIALAIVLPIFVPADSRNWLANLFHDSGSNGFEDGIGRQGGTGGINPFVSLKGQLDRKDPIDLLEVTADTRDGRPIGPSVDPQLFYSRTNVLSRFTGDGWVVGSDGQTESVSDSHFSNSPGVSFPPNFSSFTVHIKIDQLHSNPPSFAQPIDINGLDSSTKWSLQDQLLEDGTIGPGDQYDIDVAQPTPTVDQLQAATGSDPAMKDWLALPEVATYVHDLVARLTKDASTPYDRALAIDRYFTDPKNNFVYSTATQRGDSGDELVDFLENKFGYCQQYAASMGVMLRLADIPSRIVLGYTHPIPSSQGSFTITTDDAHAWVEAYFDGIGWIPFDPTPLQGIAGGARSDLPWAKHPTGSGAPTSGPSIDTSSAPAPPRRSSEAPPVAQPAISRSSHTSLGGPLVATGIVVLVIVLALVPWAVRQRRRSRRLRSGRAGDVDAIWTELSDTAADLGYTWSQARTPRQVASWLRGPAGAGADALAQLTTSVERARYAPSRSAVDGPRLIAELDAVRSGLQAGRPWAERAGARFLPASLGWRLVDVVRGLRLRRRH